MTDPYSRPATGYPAPQPQHPNGYLSSATAYPYYYNQQAAPLYPNSSHRTTLLRRLIASIIVVFVLFFIIFFICWLVIRPHRPQFHIVSLSLSGFNVSSPSQSLTGSWNAGFQAYNPNKKLKISYNQIVCSLLYKSEILSQTRLPPFSQDIRNLTSVAASFSAINTYVHDWVAKGIDGDRTHGSVAFNVRMAADVGFKVGGLRARRRLLRVLCDDVTVGLSASSGVGNLTGGARECKVYA